MTARFPQSASSVAYRIKPTWASKILVMYWAASADSVHRLRSSDTASAIITRAASGATFNATTGLIEGNSSTYFSDSISGGYGGLIETSDYTLGVSYFGDLYNGGGSVKVLIGTAAPPDDFDNGAKIYVENYGVGAAASNYSGQPFSLLSNDVDEFMIGALRNNQSDVTAKQRLWQNGAEITTSRSSGVPVSTSGIGTPARPIYFGSTFTGTGNTKMWGEFWFLGTGALTDADLVAITADPSILIEASPVDATAPVLSSPTGSSTGTTTASGTVSTDEAAGTLYRLASINATETASTIKAAALTTTVTATGTQSVTFTGLSASTTYYAHYVQDDAVPNTSNVVHSTSFTTSASGDTTAPTLSSPTGTATGSTTASGTVTTNEANGTLYSLVSTNSTETAATVKASGASQTITTTGVKTATATGLTASTVYYYHYVHRDAAGNDSTVSNSSSFTTSAVSTGSFTSRPMVNDTNTVFASQAGWTVRINNATTGDRIATKTSLTTSALGVLTYSDAGCTSGTNYEHIYIAPSGDKGMQDLVAA